MQQSIQTDQTYKKTETLISSKVWFIRNNKLKIAHKIIYGQSPPEVFSIKDAVQIRNEPTGKQPHRNNLQLY